MGTEFKRVSSVHDFSVMGASYGIPGSQIDGMNVLTVYEAVGAAVAKARDEGQPSFLEIKTYRYKGHSMSDPATYRTKDELESYRKQDPILVLEDMLLENDQSSREELSEVDSAVKAIVEEAVSFAEESAAPERDTMYEDIYS